MFLTNNCSDLYALSLCVMFTEITGFSTTLRILPTWSKKNIAVITSRLLLIFPEILNYNNILGKLATLATSPS